MKSHKFWSFLCNNGIGFFIHQKKNIHAVVYECLTRVGHFNLKLRKFFIYFTLFKVYIREETRKMWLWKACHYNLGHSDV